MPEKKKLRGTLPAKTFYEAFIDVFVKLWAYLRVSNFFRLILRLFNLPRTELIWLSAIFLLPIFFLPAAYTSFELPKVILFRTLTAALFVSWIFHLRRQKTLKIPALKRIRWPLWILAAVIITWIISTIFSTAPAVGFFGFYPRFQGLYTWITVIIFTAIVFLSIENKKQLERIFTAITASAFFVCVLAILQSYGVWWLNFWDTQVFLGRYFGTIGHPDYLGVFLIAVIPLLVAQILRKKSHLFTSATLVLALTVLYFTLSRSAYIGLFAGLLIFILLIAKKTGLRKLYKVTLAVPVVLIFIFLVAQIYSRSDVVSQNIFLSRLTLHGENLRSIETRLQLWPATVRQIFTSPYTGFGLDTFAITFPAYAPKELNTLENLGDYSDRAHNFILDYAQQLGLPALALLLLFLGMIFAGSVKNILKNSAVGKDLSWLQELGVLCGLAALIIANLFGFFVTVTWVYFWLFTAILLRMRVVTLKETSVQFLQRKYGGTILITVAVISVIPSLIFTEFNLLRSDIEYRASVSGHTEHILNAAKLSPEMSFYSIAAANSPTSAASNFVEQAGKITGYDGVYEFTKAKILATMNSADTGTHFEKALQKMPNSPFLYMEYGRYLLANGNPAKAAQMFTQFLEITPNYYSWRSDLASKTPEEQERYRIFYKLNPNFNKVFELLVDAYRKSGDQEKARYYEQYLYY